MEFLPCSCPVCSGHGPKDLDEDKLAEHNLYVSFEEIRRIKESIHENTLWELLEERAKAHPKLETAFKRFGSYRRFLESLDVFTKRRFFVTTMSRHRPEVYRHDQRMKKGFKSKKLVDLPPFRKVPVEASSMYPFGQRVSSEHQDPFELGDWEKADGIARYSYFVGIP
jgi:7-cyano-7-deazaguanine tRNA-ribosyltransferase